MFIGSVFRSKIFKSHNSLQKWFCIFVRKNSRYYTLDPFPTIYGKNRTVTVLPGVGIGPEIMNSTLEVLTAVDAPLTYEVKIIRPEHEEEDFNELLMSMKRNKIVIKGNIETKSKDPLAQSRNILIRKLLDLYVYMLPLKSMPGVNTKFPKFDVVMFRQNSEGEYLMLEHEPNTGSVESLKVLTRYNTRRLAHYAYQYAVKHKRKKLTILHTAPVHQLTEGLFVDTALEVSKSYPQIQTEVMEAASMAAQCLKIIKDMDVILATNLNGGMISNMVNGMLGGPALSAGVNFSSDGVAVFEPGVRNKGSGIVGKGTANPTAMLLAASRLLTHIGLDKLAQVIEKAITRNLIVDRVLTPDLGGNATTRQFTDHVIKHVKDLMGSELRSRKPSSHKHKRFNVDYDNGPKNNGDDNSGPCPAQKETVKDPCSGL